MSQVKELKGLCETFYQTILNINIQRICLDASLNMSKWTDEITYAKTNTFKI